MDIFWYPPPLLSWQNEKLLLENKQLLQSKEKAQKNVTIAHVRNIFMALGGGVLQGAHGV
jgi:hypothetical protein